MRESPESIANRLDNASESLDVELKQWLNLNDSSHLAKVIKTCIALYNSNGGDLIIGKEDDGSPSAKPPEHLREAYNEDVIQGALSKYASKPFPIDVYHLESQDLLFVVIHVSSGVQTPVFTKKALTVKTSEGGSKTLIKRNTIYVRTLRTNNTASTAELQSPADWDALMDICFDNREADIGRFIRRHIPQFAQLLGGKAGYLQGLTGNEPENAVDESLVDQFMQKSYERFIQRSEGAELTLPEHGALQTAFKIIGEAKPMALDKDLLRLMKTVTPRHSGWPPWVILENAPVETYRPRITMDCWEAFIPKINSSLWEHIDYWRFNAQGHFYSYTGYADDFARGGLSPSAPLLFLDFYVMVREVADRIASALAYAKVISRSVENNIQFLFKWNKLEGRTLASWMVPSRNLQENYQCHDETKSVYHIVPIDTPPSVIAEHVYEVVRQLFLLFDGFNIAKEVVHGIVKDFLK